MKTLALLATGLVFTLFGFADSARAATTVITSGTDAELRAAVANCGTVTFNFDGVITLTNEIVVTCAVTIDATGRSVVLSGGNSNRLFQVQSNGNLTLINLALVNGRSANAGGAIYNGGALLAVNCGFLQNIVLGTAGANGTNGSNGISSDTAPAAITAGQPGEAGSPGANAQGGAIFSEGSVELRGCQFANNVVTGGAGGSGGRGGNGGRYPLSGFPSAGANGGNGGAGGFGGLAQGGAISSDGFLSLAGCVFFNSFATGGFGGNGGFGEVRGNTPSYAAGGNGGAPGTTRGGGIFSAGPVWISNSVFVGNSCLGGNAGHGGGGSGPLGNDAYTTNGGVALGGAIYFSSTGLIANSTFYTNFVRGGDVGLGIFSSRHRGGDGIGGGLASAGTTLAVNLTFQHNRAAVGLSTNFGTNGNSLGGSIANTGGVFQVVNSILNGGSSNNTFGTITDLGHNLSSDATPVWTSGTSLNNTDPLLLPLANYGGPTLTMALHAGSPALNTADCALAPATDQRGFPRPDGPGCDIGAYEGASAPSLQIFRVNSSTNLLRWIALAGRTYRVDGANSLNAWSPYSTNVAATNGLLELPVPVAAPERFFRLQAE